MKAKKVRIAKDRGRVRFLKHQVPFKFDKPFHEGKSSLSVL